MVYLLCGRICVKFTQCKKYIPDHILLHPQQSMKRRGVQSIGHKQKLVDPLQEIL